MSARFEEEKQKRRYAELLEKEAEELARVLAKKHNLPYLNLLDVTIDLDSLKLIPEKDAREGKMAAFQSVGRKLSIAVLNPEILKTKSLLEDLKNRRYTFELYLVSPQSLEKVFSRYPEIPAFEEVKTAVIDISPARLAEFEAKVKSISSLKYLLVSAGALKESRKISEILEMILAAALSLEASDIHIEPAEASVNLRLRIDGVLQEVSAFSHKIYQMLLSRVKLLSELKLNIKDRAQDGRFTIRTERADVEVRTATLPGPYGEAVTLRVLHPKTIALRLEDLGMHESLLKLVEGELKKPNGMILTTGPTGSGKTTTLYTFVKKVVEPGIEIITIEDPIEYHLAGITQTQVDSEKGYDFSNGLKAILRQDPDVILVGEIRDFETAETAMHAALTGHLVFSTLHTNNAAGTIPRLIDMGVKPNIIAPAVNVAMAQRLVRKLCSRCAKEKKISPEEKKYIEKELKGFPKKINRPDLAKIRIFEAKGCEECGETGYKGRVGVFEAFLVNDEIERLILSDPSEASLRKAVLEQGMLTMREDGILKVLSGITSLEELERVVGE